MMKVIKLLFALSLMPTWFVIGSGRGRGGGRGGRGRGGRGGQDEDDEQCLSNTDAFDVPGRNNRDDAVSFCQVNGCCSEDDNCYVRRQRGRGNNGFEVTCFTAQQCRLDRGQRMCRNPIEKITSTTSPTYSPTVSTPVEATTSPTLAPIVPTGEPTTVPQPQPTTVPTAAPIVPTHEPTTVPTVLPTHEPTTVPTAAPIVSTHEPTTVPTTLPTHEPTSVPTAAPIVPTHGPTIAPETAADLFDSIKAVLEPLLSEDLWMIPTLVRLVFHDASGGMDGCVDLQNPDNNGLNRSITFIETHTSQFADRMEAVGITRADLWYFSSLIGLDLLQAPDIDITFLPVEFYGRKVCDENGDGREETAVQSLPGPDLSTRDLLEFFRTHFKLQTDETIAFLGAHSIGRARCENSGFSFVWDDTPLVFDNRYFQLGLVPWCQDQCDDSNSCQAWSLCGGPTGRANPPNTKTCDTRGQELTDPTDLTACNLPAQIPNPPNRPCADVDTAIINPPQCRPNARPPSEEQQCAPIRFLNSDISLFRDFHDFTIEDSSCGVNCAFNGPSRCPFAAFDLNDDIFQETLQGEQCVEGIARRFAADNTLFVSAFKDVFSKIANSPSDLLPLVEA